MGEGENSSLVLQHFEIIAVFFRPIKSQDYVVKAERGGLVLTLYNMILTFNPLPDDKF